MDRTGKDRSLGSYPNPVQRAPYIFFGYGSTLISFLDCASRYGDHFWIAPLDMEAPDIHMKALFTLCQLLPNPYAASLLERVYSKVGEQTQLNNNIS